jgi:aminomethyltransferase
MAPLSKSPLHTRHQAAGAKLVPFAGWEMPLQYGGIRQEHEAVRSAVGVFDVSHMGQIESNGPDSEAFLQRLLSNDVTRIPEGGAQYSVLCREDGGVLDDLFSYRRGPDKFLTVTNAANHQKDLAWFRRQAADLDVEVADRRDDWAMLAIQGPHARGLLTEISDGEFPARFRTTDLLVSGVRCLACGTGYTGEDGCELLVPPGGVETVWDALVDRGATPVGLGARDTLRLEVCFHLYGNDLSEVRSPIEAGLSWCCKTDTNFIGAAAMDAATPAEILVPFAFTDRGIPRPGNEISTACGPGEVTSGTLSPSLGIGIGMGYVPIAASAPGTQIEVDVRGTRRPAVVRDKPLYRKES